MARHRAPLRPRYGRISALGAALLVTLVAVLGGSGLLPDGPGDPGPERAEQASAPTAGVSTAITTMPAALARSMAGAMPAWSTAEITIRSTPCWMKASIWVF